MKRSTILISLLCFILSAWGQHLSSDTILSRIWLQTNVFPQEKLYLQTDKVDYVAGETTQTMDLRSTIYWKPDIQFKEGEAEISFYAADSPVDYSILVEGISHEGNLLRLQDQIK